MTVEGDVSITNCTFRNNTHTGNPLFLVVATSFELHASTFTNNHGTDTSMVSITGPKLVSVDTVIIRQCEFHDILSFYDALSVNITGLEISESQADFNVRTLLCQQGSIERYTSTNNIITNGGALTCSTTTVNITDSLIS